MKHSKQYYRELALKRDLDGYEWVGFWDNRHHFTKRYNKPFGYGHIQAAEECLDNGNLEYYIRYGLSFPPKRCERA